MPAAKTNGEENGFFSVIAVTYFPGKGYHRTTQVNFLQRSSAYDWVDKLQDQIDSDGSPARAYVIDKDGVAIRAGRCASYRADYFFKKYDPPLRKRA